LESFIHAAIVTAPEILSPSSHPHSMKSPLPSNASAPPALPPVGCHCGLPISVPARLLPDESPALPPSASSNFHHATSLRSISGISSGANAKTYGLLTNLKGPRGSRLRDKVPVTFCSSRRESWQSGPHWSGIGYVLANVPSSFVAFIFHKFRTSPPPVVRLTYSPSEPLTLFSIS